MNIFMNKYIQQFQFLGEEKTNNMEELTEPVTIDVVSGVPSLAAIAQLTYHIVDDVCIADGSE